MTALTITPRARKRLVNTGLDVLTWVVLAIMLAPVFWLLISAFQDDRELSTGAYVTTLITGRVNYNFSTRMFLNALLQYNTDSQQWSSNLRFNVIHRPLSDFFLVYNERRDDRSGELIDRAIVAKMTYLMAF